MIDIIGEFGEDHEGDTISFTEFLDLMARRTKDTDTDEELKQGFKIFDENGDDKISIDDLRALMTKLGENLSEQEL